MRQYADLLHALLLQATYSTRAARLIECFALPLQTAGQDVPVHADLSTPTCMLTRVAGLSTSPNCLGMATAWSQPRLVAQTARPWLVSVHYRCTGLPRNTVV
jgi:hypothetical protein